MEGDEGRGGEGPDHTQPYRQNLDFILGVNWKVEKASF